MSEPSARSRPLRQSALSTTSDIVSLALEVTKAVSGVPYVGAIAVILQRLIQIRDELETQKDRCQELLDRVEKKSHRLLTYLLELGEHDKLGGMKRLENHMLEYKKFLEKVLSTITRLQKRNTFRRILNRDTSELDKLDRIISNFDTDLISGMILELIKSTPTSKQEPSEVAHPSDISDGMQIPPVAECVLEREDPHKLVVTQLLAVPNTRVALLGMGGIGKTTLACHIARDPQVVAAYPRRLFLSFEGCSTPDLAYTTVANAFHIPADRRTSHRQILSQALDYLRQQKTLFILDNFETFWEVSGNRRAAEDFLSQFASLQELALIVTLRGIQRPGTIRWFIIEPLKTLTESGSNQLLHTIAGEDHVGRESEYIQKLLSAVAGIPLAVTLIGSLLRDGSESPQSLWHQWTRESARAIRVAAGTDSNDDRLFKLDISLRLSVFGPRMNDDTRTTLAAISILPNGLNMDDNWLDKLQDILPSTFRLRNYIRTLRDVALGSLDSSVSPPRLRLLPPIRDFCLNNLPPDNDFTRKLFHLYHIDVQTRYRWTPPENYIWVTTELSNLTAIISHAFTIHHITEQFGHTCATYSNWRRFLGMPETDIVERAIHTLSEYPSSKTRCLRSLGSTLRHLDRPGEAIPWLEQAVVIDKGIGNNRGAAWSLSSLGSVHMSLKQYDSAERSLKDAVEIFTDIGEIDGKAQALQKLSDVYLRQDKLDEAKGTAIEALDLGLTLEDQMVEASTLETLGRLYRKRGNHDLALDNLNAAGNIYRGINSTCGQANANESLGYLYHDMGRPDQAATHIRAAILLYEQAQSFQQMENLQIYLKNIVSDISS